MTIEFGSGETLGTLVNRTEGGALLLSIGYERKKVGERYTVITFEDEREAVDLAYTILRKCGELKD